MKADMKNNGFSLLEVIIAMLILSLVTAGTFSLNVTCQKFLNDARQKLQAAERASSVLEQLSEYVSADPNNPVDAGYALEVVLKQEEEEEGVWEDRRKREPSRIGLEGTPDMQGVCNPQWSYVVEDVPDIDGKKVTLTVKWDAI